MTSEDALIVAATDDVYKTANASHLEYHGLSRERGRMSGQLRLRIGFKKYATRWFNHLIVSKEDMEKILKGTGWIAKELIESEGS